MRNIHNLDKHPLRSRTYTAYDAAGFAFRVTPSGNRWQARPSYAGAERDNRYFFADKLGEIAKKVGASRQGEI